MLFTGLHEKNIFFKPHTDSYPMQVYEDADGYISCNRDLFHAKEAEAQIYLHFCDTVQD